MRKFWLSLTLLVVLALTACQPATPAATPTAVVPTATAEAAAVPTVSLTAGAQEATCRPYRLIDLVLPPSSAAIPEPRDTDWIRGPSSAKVTLIDYSDFQ